MQVPNPQELADALYIQNMFFPNDKYESLTQMVKQISCSFHLPYSAQNTGKNLRSQKYICCFGGKVRGKTSKTGCLANFVYSLNDDGSFSADSPNLIHNHYIFKEYVDAHRNCCSEEEIQEINQMQQYGVPPDQIRTHLDINVNKYIFITLEEILYLNQNQKI